MLADKVGSGDMAAPVVVRTTGIVPGLLCRAFLSTYALPKDLPHPPSLSLPENSCNRRQRRVSLFRGGCRKEVFRIRRAHSVAVWCSCLQGLSWTEWCRATSAPP